jgi:surfactin family lipopeptide synthetase A
MPEDLSITTQSMAIPQRKTYPLTLAQQGIWFLWLLEPDSLYFTDQGIIHIRGTISLPVLQRAWQAVLERHAILRVRFSVEDGNPVQIFEQRSPADLPLIDITHLPKTDQWHTIQKEAKTKAKHALNLEKDPLLEAKLFKLSENEYQVLLTFHQITLDLCGLSIIVHDLGQLYQGFSKGEESPLLPLEMQFGDYALWENEQIQRHKLRVQEAYWKKELSGELPILNLPTDRSRPASLNYRGASKSLILDADLSRQLKTLSFQEDATLFMTLLAAFNILLHFYSGQDDLIVGAPIANRTHEGAEDLAGYLLNMLPLRTRLENDRNFVDLLKQVRSKVTSGITHADYPFMWMLEGINVVRDMSITPVFQVMFNMLNLPHVSLEFGDLEFTYNQVETGYIKYDLTLYAQEHGDQIYLQLAYLTDLFNEDTIDRMLKNLVVILKSIVENPKLEISALNKLNEAEKQALLYDFNDTDRDFNNDHLCIHQLFEQQVQRTPDQTAFIFEEQHLTYAELNRRSNQLAHYLRRHGVGKETVVALCLERSFEMIVGLLAIMKAGGTYVALEPNYPLLRLYDILQDAKPSVLLIQKHLDRFDEFTGTKIYIDNEWKLIEEEETTNPNCLTTTDNLLNIVYTSSSTGKPKGTLITINNVLNRLFWMWDAYPFRPGDVGLLQKSYALVGATWELFGAILKGFPTVVLAYQDLLNPAEIWKKVVKHNVPYLLASPAFLEGILIQGELHPGQWYSLRLATTSAEPITPDMVARWEKVFPQVPLLNLYASTECASGVTGYNTSQMSSDAVRVPVGKPLANIHVYILDDNLKPVPIGVTGEMCITGACVSRGYLNLPELTAKKFVPNPFSGQPGSVLYKTGDLARYRSDGDIELIGRKDHQVKIRGFRVELGEIETVLSEHEAVSRCAVIIREYRPGDTRLIAYIEPKPDYSVTATELRKYMRTRLPEYMVPQHFVELVAMPLTPAGKIDRKGLPTPSSAGVIQEDGYVEPHTETEKKLATIWQEVLGVDRISIYDNFFHIGGHSLLAIQLLSRLKRFFQIQLSLRQLFQSPTIKELASILDQKETSSPLSSLVLLRGGGFVPPFYFVPGMLGNVFMDLNHLVRHLGPNQPVYGLQDGIGLPSKIEALATHFTDEIRAVQPKGPYFLGGICFGAALAFEMAQQLRNQKQEIGLLALVEPASPSLSRLRAYIRQTAFLLGRLTRRVGQRSRNISQLSLDEKKIYFRLRMKLIANYFALARYVERPYPGRIHLFLTHESLASSRNPRLGWCDLAIDGVEIHEIPGTHNTITGLDDTPIDENHMQALAEKLKACTNKALL